MTVLSVVLLVIAGTPAAYLTGSVALRRRVQDRVDRRFNRALYDARREVDRFADRLRDEVELGDLAGDHGGAVAGTLRPAVATIWVRGWA